MPDTHPDLDTLLELDRVDRELHRLKDALAKGTQAVRREERRLAELEERLTEMSAEHKNLRKDADLANVEVNSTRQRILDTESRLNKAASNKEYQAFLNEIAEERRTASRQEERVLELLEEVDEMAGQLKTFTEEVEAARGRVAELKEKAEADQGGTRKRIEELEKERAGIAEGVDDGVLARYDRVAARHTGGAVADLVGTTCQGCWAQLTKNQVQTVRGGDIGHCPNCQRILRIQQ